MKKISKYFILLVTQFFIISCTIAPIPTPIVTETIQLSTTPTTKPLEITPAFPVTETTQETIKYPLVTESLPDEIIPNWENLPVHFGTHFTEIPSGHYILSAITDELSRDKITTEIWLYAVDEKQKYLLFTCDECQEKYFHQVAFNDGKLYLQALGLCGILEIDLINQEAKQLSLDISSTPPESPFHHCTISPNTSFRNYLYITQAISPDGKWQVYGTSPNIDSYTLDTPDKPQTLLLHSSQISAWFTVELEHEIKSLLWTPSGELLIEVGIKNCGGEIGAYILSPDTRTIQDISSFYCGFDRPSPRVLGWLPNGETVLTWGRNLGMSLSFVNLDQVTLCPQETLKNFDTDPCRIIATGLENKIGIAAMLATSDNGLYIAAYSSRIIGEHVYFLNTKGYLDYRGYLNEYIQDISSELNRGIVITGAKYNIVTYVNMEDISQLSNFQIRTGYIQSASWLEIP